MVSFVFICHVQVLVSIVQYLHIRSVLEILVGNLIQNSALSVDSIGFKFWLHKGSVFFKPI